MILDESKKMDIKKISTIIGDRLHFGKEEQLKEKLNLVPKKESSGRSSREDQILNSPLTTKSKVL